jgi:hypothetical protein
MKLSRTIGALILCKVLSACSAPDSAQAELPVAQAAVASAAVYTAFDEIASAPDASITHDGDWKIVSRQDNGDRVYWFVAPDMDNASPALFKKTIHASAHDEVETKIVSHCEAPKPVCDALMEEFKLLSERYQ